MLFLELARRDQNRTFERTQCLVVILDCAFKRLAHGTEILGKRAQAIKQLLADFADIARTFRQGFLTPAIRHRLEQAQKRGGRCQDHPIAEAVLDQPRVAFKGGREEAFTRQEQHNKFRAVHRLPIGLFRKFRNHLAHIGDIGRHQCFAAFIVIFLVNRLKIGRCRGLGIHHDVLAARQVNDHVGFLNAFVGIEMHLLVKVTMLEHPGKFDNALELQFAPLARHR